MPYIDRGKTWSRSRRLLGGAYLSLLASCARDRQVDPPAQQAAAPASAPTVQASIAGAVILYGHCKANVTTETPRIALDPGCTRTASKVLAEELNRIATLQGGAEARLDDAETARLLSLLRNRYASARLAEIDLEASRRSLESTQRVLRRTATLLTQDYATRYAMDAAAAQVHFAQANVEEKNAAYRFAISESPVDELEIYKARARRFSYLAARSAEVVADANDQFLRGRSAFATLASAELEQVRDQEALSAACGAMVDQLEFVRTISAASRKPVELPSSPELFQGMGCKVRTTPSAATPQSATSSPSP